MRRLAIAAALLLGACTDATIGSFGEFGTSAHVRCVSGGAHVYEGDSTGAVMETQGGGIQFVDRATGQYTFVYAHCLVVYGAKGPQ